MNLNILFFANANGCQNESYDLSFISLKFFEKASPNEQEWLLRIV